MAEGICLVIGNCLMSFFCHLANFYLVLYVYGMKHISRRVNSHINLKPLFKYIKAQNNEHFLKTAQTNSIHFPTGVIGC